MSSWSARTWPTTSTSASPTRRYGAEDPQVLERIGHVLLDLSHRVAPEQRQLLRDQLARWWGTVDAQSFDTTERAALAALALQVEQRLDGPPPGARPR